MVGAGGFGREVVDIVEAIHAQLTAGPIELLGVLDDAPSEENLALLAKRGLPFLGSIDSWLETGPNCDYVIGVANPDHRRSIDRKLSYSGLSAATLVHPASTLGSDVVLGEGSIVCAGARLTTNIRCERHVHVHVNATIGHDTVLGAYVSAYPQSAISGSCMIDEGATVGASATIIQGIHVGERAFVGAGAVVCSDVPARVIVKGVPAR